MALLADFPEVRSWEVTILKPLNQRICGIALTLLYQDQPETI